jgi:hypothetical protein
MASERVIVFWILLLLFFSCVGVEKKRDIIRKEDLTRDENNNNNNNTSLRFEREKSESRSLCAVVVLLKGAPRTPLSARADKKKSHTGNPSRNDYWIYITLRISFSRIRT